MSGSSIKDLQQQHHHNHQQEQQHSNHQTEDPNNEHIDIDELARDISENLNDKEYFEDDNFDGGNDDGLTLKVPYNLKGPLFLLIIYFIMSQGSVRQLFGKYISYLNPDENGIVSQLGIIIYGIIMVGIYMVINKFL